MKISQSPIEWWRNAVFYQIYPRSFYDSNNDGIGDLKGITDKLEYIRDLGVDAIWISPFFKSPMHDFGYDVSDYRAVDPIFGTMDDFDSLLKKAHNLNLKVIIDVILSHTSKDHEWFQESRQGGDNSKSDWYVWADAKPDGTPPNNWQSVFGGAAWTFDTHRGKYYLHNFLKEQPDLNYHNPEVQQAALDLCRFWLDKGVDGFRLDAINYMVHDALLRDNPPKNPDIEGYSTQFQKPDPYSMQRHVYDKSRPEALDFAKRFRALTDEYDAVMSVAEIGDDNFMQSAAQYTSENRYNTAYNFALLTGDELTSSVIQKAVEAFFDEPGDGWPSWSFSNHDVVRVVSRWGAALAPDYKQSLSKMLLALLTSLRGTIFLYQGEELGLTEAEIPYEHIQDPWGKYLWPEWQGRDGCRTPMPWDGNAPFYGFTRGDRAWLPLSDDHKNLSVNRQENDKSSTLAFTRDLLRWRKSQPALMSGDIRFLETGDKYCLGFERKHDGQSLHCYFNVSEGDKTIALPAPNKVIVTPEDMNLNASIKHGHLILPAFSFAYLESKDT